MAERRVLIQPEAERNVAAIFNWLAQRSPQGAATWYEALRQAIARLGRDADSLPLAQESRHFSAEIRELLFKTRRGQVYRLLFTIRDDEAHVLYLRGPGQDWLPEQG